MAILLPALAIVLDLVLPIALLAWAALTRAKSRAYLGSIILLSAVVIAVVSQFILGFWHIVGVFWPAVFLVAFTGILIFRLLRGLPASWLPKRWGWETFLTGLNVVHAALWAALIPPLLQARSYEGETLNLSSPLRGGSFYVMSGGANNSVNQHSDYAMDVGKLNALGFSAEGLYPRDLQKYPVFGVEIIAPCAGEVIAAENTKPNQPVLNPNGEDRRGGNHVVIFCNGYSVHLAHMQAGTVAVAVGDHVAVGQALGRVGNSGNATQPHVHLNAARGRWMFERGEDSSLAGAESVPFLIDGKFLIKGDSFSNQTSGG
jgi:hypothetical protein